MTLRRLTLAAGFVAFAVGIAAAVAPAAVAISVDEMLVPLVGVLALLQAARVANARRRTGSRQADPGDPERIASSPQPGDDLDDTLAGYGWTTWGRGHFRNRRSRIRDGIRTAAATVLSRYGGLTLEAARERLERGTWTDDRIAAAFLGGRRGPGVPLRARLRGLADGTTGRDLSVGHAIDAIVDVAAGAAPFPAARTVPDDDLPREARNGPPADGPAGDATGDADGDDELRSAGGGVRYRPPRPTHHWDGVGALALAAIGAGVLVERPPLLLVGVVGIAFAAYARSGAPPVLSLGIERTLGTDRPGPDEEVAVTLTVRNDGDRTLPDLRIVDGVPPALAVADGPPRVGTALRPGEEATISYSIVARRGVHDFGPVHAIARDLSAGTEQEWFVDVETELVCVPPLRATAGRLPLAGTTVTVGGAAPTVGGDGAEFHATREYRPGDALSRIDWNYHARTGDLATLELRQERAAAVVLLVDARNAARVAPTPGDPHAVDRAVSAAGRLFARLADDGARVGIAAVGSASCFLAPGAGDTHRTRAGELLATHPALSSTARGTEANLWRWRRRLARRLAPGTQLVFLSPLSDAYATRLARYLDAAGYPVTVLSPDPSSARTASQRLARVGRRLAVAELRDAGIPVLDWSWDASLEAALARAAGRDRP